MQSFEPLILTQPEPPLDREAFRQAIKARYVSRGGVDESTADMFATAQLEFVEDEAGGFGVDGYAWDRTAAEGAADEDMSCWEGE